MGALGVFRAGQKNPLESWPKNIARRFLLFGFGVLVALLVLWTPYAWVRLLYSKPLVGALAAIVLVLTMLVRLGRLVFPSSLGARRFATLAFFALLFTGAVGT